MMNQYRKSPSPKSNNVKDDDDDDDIITSSTISAMKSRHRQSRRRQQQQQQQERIPRSYFQDRACDHWECGFHKCIHSETAQHQQTKHHSTELGAASGPLHQKQEKEVDDDDSSQSASPVSSLVQPLHLANNSSGGDMERENEELPRLAAAAAAAEPTSKSRPKASSHTSSSSRGSTEKGGGAEPSSLPSLAAEFVLNDEDLEGMEIESQDEETEEETEQSQDDLKSTCSGMTSGSSTEFFKTAVRNMDIVDNTKQQGTFTGTLDKRTSKPHGYGTMVYPDAIYEGQWVNGDWCGFGRLTDINTGDVYQGGFFDNMKHGLGVMKYSDGRIYDGMFMLDKLEGKGRLTEVDGTKFWGYWSKDGVPHGRGKKELPDGKVYDGEFDQGVFSGHGRMTFPDGTWYLGEWCDGLPNGLGMKVDANGDLLFEGMYSNGEPIEASSMRHAQKSSGKVLLYRNSVAPQGHGTLVGPLPRQVYMHHRMDWALKNL